MVLTVSKIGCVSINSNEQFKKEIKKASPFTIASKNTKYLGINLTKEVNYMYTENCKTLLKEIKT